MTLALTYHPALSRPDLLAPPVAAALHEIPWADQVQVAAIDPTLSDTAQFCEAYSIGLEESVNCVVIAAKRGGEVTYAACMVAATTRANVNGLVRQHLGARKASFGAVDVVTSLTGMEYGGITPVGLPADWRILVDDVVAKVPSVVIGAGIRGAKLRLPGGLLAELPGADILPGLGVETGEAG
jgi:prolyl-tRNA editing enzyme YbaK/EbsC (Cys-tRNA(Pro) deacylase)